MLDCTLDSFSIDFMAPADNNPSTEQLIRNEELRMLYASLPFATAASILVAVIYLVILYDHAESQQTLFTWFGGMVLISLLRAWDAWRYRETTDEKKQSPYWDARFLAGTTLAGTGWGLLAWLGYSASSEYLAVIIIGIVGITSGALSTLSYRWQTIALFLVPAVGLLELRLLLVDSDFAEVSAWLILFYMLFSLFTSRRIYRNTNTNVRLRIEADEREKALLHTTQEAEHANQAKSEFLSHMSHELRTPLNAIIGFTQLLEYDHQLNGRQRSQIQEIAQAGSHLLSLVNRILDLASIEEGAHQLNIQQVSVNALVSECQSLTRSLAEKHLVTISIELKEQYYVDADYTGLKQVLLNLLSNAIKYNKAGGSVFIFCDKTGDNTIRISVRDTGIGLTLEQIEYIFEPFNRLGTVGNKIEGTGIGLSITRDLVRHMHGDMGVEGRVGHGSLFWVELPGHAEPLEDRNKAGGPLPAAAPPQQTNKTRPADKQRILIAEDNPANQLLLANQLKLFGYECDQANNGKQALELFKQNDYALVLTDCNMPLMDGYQLSLAIRETDSHTPIIAITADAFPDSEDRCSAVGMNDRLIKPVQLYALKELLAKWVNYKG